MSMQKVGEFYHVNVKHPNGYQMTVVMTKPLNPYDLLQTENQYYQELQNKYGK